LAVNGLNGFVAAWVLGPQNAAVQVVTPNEMRGQITALVIFMINIFGFGLGVWVVALTTTYVFGAEEHLRYSLALVNGVLGVPATLAIIWAMKPYAEALRRARKEWG
jgi:hypothetical protein